jgi:hypothetical protein
MVSVGRTDRFPPLLENFNAPVLFQHEFIPTGGHRGKCNYDVAVFYDIANDLMESEFFERNFGNNYFAIYYFNS